MNRIRKAANWLRKTLFVRQSWWWKAVAMLHASNRLSRMVRAGQMLSLVNEEKNKKTARILYSQIMRARHTFWFGRLFNPNHHKRDRVWLK